MLDYRVLFQKFLCTKCRYINISQINLTFRKILYSVFIDSISFNELIFRSCLCKRSKSWSEPHFLIEYILTLFDPIKRRISRTSSYSENTSNHCCSWCRLKLEYIKSGFRTIYYFANEVSYMQVLIPLTCFSVSLELKLAICLKLMDCKLIS